HSKSARSGNSMSAAAVGAKHAGPIGHLRKTKDTVAGWIVIPACGCRIIAPKNTIPEFRVGDALNSIAAFRTIWRADAHHTNPIDSTSRHTDQSQSRYTHTRRYVGAEHAGPIGDLRETKNSIASRIGGASCGGRVVTPDYSVAVL